MSVSEAPDWAYDDLDGDETCQRCGGDGFIFECFDGCCRAADVGCDDCTTECPDCTPREPRSGSPS